MDGLIRWMESGAKFQGTCKYQFRNTKYLDEYL